MLFWVSVSFCTYLEIKNTPTDECNLSRARKKERKNVVTAVESVEKRATCVCCPLFHRPFRGKREKREGYSAPIQPQKTPSENGVRKRIKGTCERKVYSRRFSSGLRAKTSSEGAMRLGKPLRTIRVISWPVPKRKSPYLVNCWRVMPWRASSFMR